MGEIIKMVILVTLVYVVVAYLQIRVLIRERYWRELAAFSFFYMIAFTLSLFYVFGVNIPSPIFVIKSIVKM